MSEDSRTREFCDQVRSEKMGSEKAEKNNGQSDQNSDGEESEKSAEDSCRRMLACGNDPKFCNSHLFGA